MTPEEYFLREAPRPYLRSFEPNAFLNDSDHNDTSVPFTKKSERELVVLCGSPGAGKSTYYWTVLQGLGYERVNQDTLKTRDKCVKVATELLAEGKSVAVDNTNADAEVRAIWINLARPFAVPARCVWFEADAKLCDHNNAVRALNGSLMNPESRVMLPQMAFASFAKRFKQPVVEEGFEDITVVKFRFKGTAEERAIWSRYWV